jgi:hypothetical protein
VSRTHDEEGAPTSGMCHGAGAGIGARLTGSRASIGAD